MEVIVSPEERQKLLNDYDFLSSLNEGKNLTEITEDFHNKITEDISYATIRKFILKNYKKDDQKKWYEIITKKDTESSLQIDINELITLGIENAVEKVEDNNAAINNSDPQLPSDDEINPDNNESVSLQTTSSPEELHLEKILNSIETLNKNVNFVNSEIKEIKNWMKSFISSLQEHNNEKSAQIQELVYEFMDIYKSERDRKSITVNNELLKRILEQQKQDAPSNGKGRESSKSGENISKAIDTALLTALYTKTVNAK
jgi:hypothetical protein